MKKQLLLSAIISFTVNSLVGQTFDWAKSFGGAGNDFVNSMSIDADGNVYTVGSSFGLVDFDPGVGTENLTGKNVDIFISKLDASGNYVWAKVIGGTNVENAGFSTLDNDGNLIVGGTIIGEMNETTGEVSAVFEYTSFVCKIDPSGNFLWIKTFEATSFSDLFFNAADVSSTGNIYLTGSFKGTKDFDPSAASSTLTSSGSTASDLFICKLDASGNFVWAKSMGGEGSDVPRTLVVDADENLYLTGNYVGKSDFDPSAAVFELSSAYYEGATVIGFTAFIAKYDKDGSLIWAKSMDGKETVGYALAVDNVGNVYAAGSFQEKCDVNPGVVVDERISAGGIDSYLCKLGSDGAFIWAKTVGGSGNDYADAIYSLDLDVNGDVYASGSFRSGSFPAGTNSFLNAYGTNDVFVMKLKADGELAWAEQVGGRLRDNNNAIKLGADGSIYLAGSYYGDAIFNPTVNEFEYNHPDNIISLKSRSEYTEDVYVVKWNQEGLLANEKNLDRSNQIAIYPNPTTGKVNLSEHINSIEVYNAQGMKILNNVNPTNQLDLTSLNAGVYFIKYTTSKNEIITKKITKN